MFRRRKNQAAKSAEAAKKDNHKKGIKSPSSEPSASSSENTSNPEAASFSSSSNDKTDSVFQSSSSQAPSSMDQENNANANNSNDLPKAQPVAKERSLKSLRSLMSRGTSKDGSKSTFHKSKSTEISSTLPDQVTSSSLEASLSQRMVESTTTSIGTEKTQKTQNVSIVEKEESTKISYVNYDVNPTLLYKFIEYKDWDEVLNRIRDAPEEINIWVYRLEQYDPDDDNDELSLVVPDDSEIRWKMLPIHVAIIFNAPIKVVMALHKASPKSLSQRDDRKMLPIHLACRVVSNLSVAQFLIYKNADSLEAMDYKGRKPLDILKEYGIKELNSGDKRSAKNRAKLIQLMEEKLNLKKKDVAKSEAKNVEEDVDEDEENEEEEDEEEDNDDDEDDDEDEDEDDDDKTDVQDKENIRVATKSMKIQRTEPVEPTNEVNYDTYPTVLIKLIERKLWEQTITRCNEVPQEAATWMSRLQEVKDKKNGKESEVRWRILPIHSAIVLHAPVEVIEALVEAYPKGLQQGDDREMLPLHMAFRLGSSPETAAVLVDAYPEALKKKDSRGHTPLHILKAYRRKYIRDRENGKKSVSEMDANRKKLIKFYLGGRRYGESTDESQVRTFDSDSDSDYDSDDSDYDSDDDEPLFYKEMFNDFAKLTTKGISSFPNIMRDTLVCRGGSYED